MSGFESEEATGDYHHRGQSGRPHTFCSGGSHTPPTLPNPTPTAGKQLFTHKALTLPCLSDNPNPHGAQAPDPSPGSLKSGSGQLHDWVPTGDNAPSPTQGTEYQPQP